MWQTLKAFLPNKLQIYILIGLSLASLAFGLYVGHLRSSLKEVKSERDNLKREKTILMDAVNSRDLYIDTIARAAVKNQAFVKNQMKYLEGIKHDASVDPDILGPAFFNGMR